MGLLFELYDWEAHFARPAQREPEGSWRTWLVNAGRGFGKTRTGAEWVRKLVDQGRGRRIALVARTSADVRDVMVEGESGLLSVSPPWFYPQWQPSKRKLTWPRQPPTGFGRIAVGPKPAEAHTYSADEPDLLRGPQHDQAWADELASWRFKATWDNLMLGLRLGQDPRVCVTTTPKPVRIIKSLMERKTTRVTGGSTYENVANLAPPFLEEIVSLYEGTALGEQELHAKLLAEAEGALWKRAWIESNRVEMEVVLSRDDDPHGLGIQLPEGLLESLDTVVVAIDPAVTSGPESNETGIVAAGRRREADGRDHFYVLSSDRSGRHSPSKWAGWSLALFEELEADQMVGEVNNGGDLVEETIKAQEPSARVVKVRASRGKRPRAEPVAALYEQGLVHHVGLHGDLEDQLCNWEPGVSSESPDRLDAAVWAIESLRARRPRRGRISLGGLEKASGWNL